MDICDFIEYIEERTCPYTFRENGRAKLSELFRKYPEDLLLECVDIGISQYFRYDAEGNLTQDSVGTFLNKLGGIAYNKSRSPIDQEVYHLKNKGRASFAYWNSQRADELFTEYIIELRLYGWSDDMISSDLRGEAAQMMNNSRNWSDWSSTMEHWINDVRHWGDEDTVSVEQLGTILPNALFQGLQSNFQSLCKQINASYENNLYDCAAVIMRRLLEGLLVLSFQNAGIESEILDKSGKHHVALDQIIRTAEQNETLALSANTKKDMMLFKDLGNYSAHKIWYNCTQGDIKPHILKYRAIIEDLLYKAGLKS